MGNKPTAKNPTDTFGTPEQDTQDAAQIMIAITAYTAAATTNCNRPHHGKPPSPTMATSTTRAPAAPCMSIKTCTRAYVRTCHVRAS